MDKEQIITSIAENYYRLSDDCMEDLATSSKILVLDKGMQLVKEGEYADKIYYVAEGSMRAFYLKDGKDISDWFAFDNDFICSINSYFLNIPSPHYIEVVEPSILLEIHRNQVEKLSDKYLAFDRLGKVILTNTLLRLQQRVVSMQFESAKQSYESLLNIRPDITQRIPLMHIASYLGITLETLSRIRSPTYRI